jgi:hypothetical protein
MSIAIKYFSIESEIRETKEKLARLEGRRRAILSKHRFLGSIRGILRKEEIVTNESAPAPVKRQAEKAETRKQEPPRKVKKSETPDDSAKRIRYLHRNALNRLVQKSSAGKRIKKEELETVVREAGILNDPIEPAKENLLAVAAGVSVEEMVFWFGEARNNSSPESRNPDAAKEWNPSFGPLYAPSGSLGSLAELKVVPMDDSFLDRETNIVKE